MGIARKRNSRSVGSEVKKIIVKIKARLKKEGIEFGTIILFGFHAKGMADKHSDIDLCFLYDPMIQNRRKLLVKLIKLINGELKIFADIVLITKHKFRTNRTSPLIYEIRTYGIKV